MVEVGTRHCHQTLFHKVNIIAAFDLVMQEATTSTELSSYPGYFNGAPGNIQGNLDRYGTLPVYHKALFFTLWRNDPNNLNVIIQSHCKVLHGKKIISTLYITNYFEKYNVYLHFLSFLDMKMGTNIHGSGLVHPEYSRLTTTTFNSLDPERCGSNFTSVFFKLILPIDFLYISNEIGLRWVPQNSIDNKSTLV